MHGACACLLTFFFVHRVLNKLFDLAFGPELGTFFSFLQGFHRSGVNFIIFCGLPLLFTLLEHLLHCDFIVIRIHGSFLVADEAPGLLGDRLLPGSQVVVPCL